jgi:predicted nuclease of predicted toxin-antitoxin system
MLLQIMMMMMMMMMIIRIRVRIRPAMAEEAGDGRSAERARGVRDEPHVDAVDVEAMAAARQEPSCVVGLESAQANRALRRQCTIVTIATIATIITIANIITIITMTMTIIIME